MSTKSASVSRTHVTIRAILAACFPAYKGRTINLTERASVTRYCEGGAWNGPSSITHEMTTDRALVTHSHFQGKDCGITITIAPPSEEQRAAMDAALDAWLSGREIQAHIIVSKACSSAYEAGLRLIILGARVVSLQMNGTTEAIGFAS